MDLKVGVSLDYGVSFGSFHFKHVGQHYQAMNNIRSALLVPHLLTLVSPKP